MKANKMIAVALAALTLGFVACKPNEPEQKLIITPAEAEVAVDCYLQNYGKRGWCYSSAC